MKSKLIAGSFGIFLTLSLAQLAQADRDHDRDDDNRLEARLAGPNEVPAVSTGAKGKFSMKIANDDSQFTYELTFSGIEGTVTQAHIHFGQANVAGGIMIWLCQSATNQPATGPSVSVCPTPGGTVTGTVTAANVIGPAGQGVSAGEFAEALAAIRRGLAYANVHSTKIPGGEIRGQIHE